MVQHETDSPLPRLQLLAVLLLAVVLRAAWVDSVDVEHFDEGVYASNLFFDENEGGVYPEQHLYAPPLVPAMLECATVFFPGTPAVMLPGIVFGALTVALLFHVARCWFGEEAAWPTAIIAALSEFHIIYSRSGLTDVVVGFFVLLAVYLGTESVRHKRFTLAAMGGVACGLAWWSKYSGWLPLAIVGTASLLWIIFHRKHARPVATLVCCLVMTAVALAVWSPVWFGLEDLGGYAAVRANHQRYVVGFGGWLDSAMQQFNAHRVLDGGLAWLSPGIALLCNFVWQTRTHGFTWNEPRDEFELRGALLLKVLLAGVMLILLAAVGTGTTSILFCIALGGLVGRLRWPAIPVGSKEASQADAVASWTLPCWVVVVWIGSLTLMTPTYRPYPRLTIPWLIAVWLGAGAGISWWLRSNLRWHGRKGTTRPVLQQNLMMAILCGLAIFVVSRNGALTNTATAAWKPRDGMRKLAEDIRSDLIPDPADVVVYTYGEPALLYHLNKIGVLARPVSSVPTDSPSGSDSFQVLLIEGPHARRTSGFEPQSSTLFRAYNKVATYNVLLSDLVQLNEREAVELLRTSARETDAFHVWRLKMKPND